MSQNKEREDANLQLIVLLTLIIEKIEYLETHGYIFGTIKSFLKNGKTKFEDFVNRVFQYQSLNVDNTALNATNKLLVMQERVELALVNQYILTVDERRQRAQEVLETYLIKPMAKKALKEMEEKNLFNF